MRIFLCFILTGLLTSCGSTLVDYDYDKNVDFSKYHTYAYDFDKINGFTAFDEKRFISAVDSVMASNGFVFSKTPDMTLGASSRTFETNSRNTIGIGVGGGGGNVGVGVGGGIPVGGRELHRELSVSIYDQENNSILWEAMSESDLKVNATPLQREQYFQKLVAKILDKFPPDKN